MVEVARLKMKSSKTLENTFEDVRKTSRLEKVGVLEWGK